jgi:hypothetical protein
MVVDSRKIIASRWNGSPFNSFSGAMNADSEEPGRMRVPRQKPSIRKLQEKRTNARCRNRALEDSGFDELDEWMVACPAADTPQSTG